MRPEPERAPDRVSGRRRRRLTFLLWLAPGPILIVAAVNLWSNPWLLTCGVVWSGVCLIRESRTAAPATPVPPFSAIHRGDKS